MMAQYRYPWQVEHRLKVNPKYPYMAIGGYPLTKSGMGRRSYSTWQKAVEAANWLASHGVEEISVRRRIPVEDE